MRKRSCLLAFAAAFMLAGCGAEVPDLSQANNNTAAQYVADALLRNDKHYDEGIDYDHSLLKPTPTPVPTLAAAEPASAGEDGKNSSGKSGNGASAQESTRTSVSVSDVYGVKDVSITPVSYQLKSSYGSSVYQIIPRGRGNKLAVVYFNIANKSQKNKRVNLAKKQVSAELLVNGSSIGGPLLSLTDNDMQNLNITLAAGQKKQGVLLFEISKKTKVDSVEIHLMTEGKEAVSSVK